MGSVRTKVRWKFGKGSRGRCQGLLGVFRAPVHGARRAVVFAIAQLSCNNLLLCCLCFSINWLI